jgi:hypothetical protein
VSAVVVSVSLATGAESSAAAAASRHRDHAEHRHDPAQLRHISIVAPMTSRFKSQSEVRACGRIP